MAHEAPRAGPDPSSTDPPDRGDDSPPGDIPAAPVGGLGLELPQDDEGIPPLDPLPRQDFWEALYTRRSIRKFKPDPVPRELIEQVLHAGIWAPSSCNYQMWDLVAVDEPELNAQLTELSLQMGNAPVNIVVAYGRDFSEENYANIQSASALIQNMSLAAQVLGLGTFWITQTGDAEKVRAMVGLPEDRMVVAVLALGYPKLLPKKGPKRRPLAQVAHFNHYGGRPIPSSIDPEHWDPDLLAIYQRARVLNGLRHNKPRAWETRALLEALEQLVPNSSGEPQGEAQRPRWLDVLPCTGILTERLARERRAFQFDVVERSPEVAKFCAARVKPRAEALAWPTPTADFEGPRAGHYAYASCLFRLEGLRAADRQPLLEAIAGWLAPDGRLLLAYVNKRSFHDLTERLRRRRGGPGGVEYVLAPDPNIGPFAALEASEVDALLARAGFQVEARYGAQAAPQREEVAFRARNFSRKSQRVARWIGNALAGLERLPGTQTRLGRFQFLVARRAGT